MKLIYNTAILIFWICYFTGLVATKIVIIQFNIINYVLRQPWGRQLIIGLVGIFLFSIPFYFEARWEEQEARAMWFQEVVTVRNEELAELKERLRIASAEASESATPSAIPASTTRPTATPRPTKTLTPKAVASSSAVPAGSPKELMKQRVAAIWGEEHWPSMDNIISHESGWDLFIVNRSSGACGLAQALPCSKLLTRCGSLDNVPCQVEWTIEYAKQRYGDPINAWRTWQTSRCTHYDNGKCLGYASNWW
jgi:hypothetical protein